MPIRINLLAEAKVAEELRRHDPVKRVIYCGAFLVAVALGWSSSLLLESMLAKKAVTDRRTAIELRTNEFQHVIISQQKIAEVKQKLDALKKFTNSRFLQGNLLNALQQVYVENLRLIRLTENQNYSSTAGTPAKTNDDGVVTPACPSSVKEKIVVSLDMRDSSANPGDQVNKIKDVVANQPYFKAALNTTNGVQLINMSAQQLGPDGKPYVQLTLECNFREVSR
jgi:predicted nucleic acid-binding protein